MRGWRESDLAPWAAMNADPEVRRYLGPLLMRRIGMTSDPAEDFDDPDVDEGPLRRHGVYRKRREHHQRSRGTAIVPA
jgi:hypothetical protein